MKSSDRITGLIVGQAVGDALGFSTAYLSKSLIKRRYPKGVVKYSDIEADGWRTKENIGSWTNNSSLMLSVLDRLIENEGVNYQDIAKRFVHWKNSTGKGIGEGTEQLLSSSTYLTDPFGESKELWKRSGRDSATNTALVRSPIVATWNFQEWSLVEKNTEEVCKLTHYDPRCIGSCVVINYILYKLLNGETFTKEELISIGDTYDDRIAAYIELGYQPVLAKLKLEHELTMSYTLKTMAAAIWSYNYTFSYFDAIHVLLMEGGDANANCAVAGAIAGVRYGVEAIPTHLVKELENNEFLIDQAKKLIKLIL